MIWTLIFCDMSAQSVQTFLVEGIDPEKLAAELVAHNSWLDTYRLIAAVEGAPNIRVADDNRSAERGLQE